MDVIHAYIYLAIAGILAIGFLGMIIYGVVLYFRGRKMGVNKIPLQDGQARAVADEDDDDEERRYSPAYDYDPTNVFYKL